MPMEDSFLGPGKSTVYRQREIITRLRFRKTGRREGSAHHRVMRPQGLCLPIISMAARLALDEDGGIAAAHISMGPVGPVPFLAHDAMASLAGRPASTASFEEATRIALDSVALRASRYRASHDYRERMVRTFLPDILRRAARRAGADE